MSKKKNFVRNDSLNLGFRIVKMLDMGYIIFINFILGFICAIMIDKMLNQNINSKNIVDKPFNRILLEVIGMLWLNGIIIYIARNLIQFIPSPFNGICGLIHNWRIYELRSASVFVFALLYYQSSLRIRMNYIYYKVTKQNMSFNSYFS